MYIIHLYKHRWSLTLSKRTDIKFYFSLRCVLINCLHLCVYTQVCIHAYVCVFAGTTKLDSPGACLQGALNLVVALKVMRLARIYLAIFVYIVEDDLFTVQ